MKSPKHLMFFLEHSKKARNQEQEFLTEEDQGQELLTEADQDFLFLINSDHIKDPILRSTERF